jgi:S1-C subfamily serine protease
MNYFDVLIILFAIGAAVGGYRLGFLTRAISWLGLLLGLGLPIAILPGLMRRVDDGSQTTMLVLAVSTMLGCSLVGQGIGLAIGSRLHIALPAGNAREVDRAAGGVLGLVGIVVVLWALLPTLSSSPVTAEQARASSIAQWVHDWTPDVPDHLRDMRRVVGETFPEVFDPMERAPEPGPPPAASGISEAQAAEWARSVVKVHGVACRRIQEGSGWALDGHHIVTNAHVVAGERETEVQMRDGSSRDATVVAYDPGRDLAVLRVPDHGLPPRPLGVVSQGTSGGVFGYPGGGDLTISPFEVSEQMEAVGTDIYDRRRSTRQVLVLASNLNPGDSGGALINPAGEVVGVAFAIAPDRSNVAYALHLDELQAVLAENDLTTAVDTGSCLI